MANFRFFVDELPSGSGSGETIRLPDAEARHACGSKRLSTGDEVVLFDGHGHEAAGRLVSVVPRNVIIFVDGIVYQARPTPALALAVTLPKGPRQDMLIEKCTELGVGAIWPIITERSVSDASKHKRTKWRRKTIEAAKQSGQVWLPALRPPGPMEDVLADATQFDQMWVTVVESANQTVMPVIDQLVGEPNPKSILAFIGPEGGWTRDEMDRMIASGAKPISLGPNVLRIETAAIAVAVVVHAMTEKKR